MDVEGFLFEDSAWRWELARRDMEVSSMGQLVDRFNENYSYSAKPLAWSRNPVNPTEGTPWYGDEQVIIVPFPGRYFVKIEKAFNNLNGPHRTKLFYKAYQVPETYWLATLQLEAMFYSDERMLIALTQGITDGFYISERSSKIIVIK
jgi:hypothetical protein